MPEREDQQPDNENRKQQNLKPHKEDSTNKKLTTNQGVGINDNQNSLKAGERGASLMEDFIFREKMTHFDHERIPERVVHARGSGAHGFFQPYKSMSEYTKAGFLQDTDKKTPVFTRFSTVVGFRGSFDLARDVRGFATKFYTEEGNFDLVANNIPVFFIQDATKFPDLVHAIKPEPHTEMPQASAAHDNFWDFISLMPESMHMIMWLMTGRAIPRSFRMMEGFGVHTFRFVNKEGNSTFVKFHWKPVQGTYAVTWDEAQKISGMDPDYHRKDLWKAIENGHYPEWELGVQLVPEEDEHEFDFDLLDATKIIPEEQVPVEPIGKLTLNRNPDNFFAETEQVAFHPGHVVPGIDFTNDPLLQGRLFSYTDTQLIRLGGPNFHEIPINRPINEVHNNQRDGFMRQQINKGRTNYDPNSMGGGCPFQAKMEEGGFSSYEERIDGRKIRKRSESFRDHFSQAKLFYRSQTEVEQKQMVDALKFELGKVESPDVRKRMVGLLTHVDKDFAKRVADGLGMDEVPEPPEQMNHSVPADADPLDYESIVREPSIEKSEALSLEYRKTDSIATRKVAFICTDGSDGESISRMKQTLTDKGAMVKIVAPTGTAVKTGNGESVPVDKTFITSSSVLFDALYVPGGEEAINDLMQETEAIHFLNEAYKHYKPIAADEEASGLLEKTIWGQEMLQEGKNSLADNGVVLISNGESAENFIDAIRQYRFWNRSRSERVPA